MDSGTRDAAVSRTSAVRAGWMGLLTGRAVMMQAHYCPARTACFDAGYQTTEPVPHEHPSLRQRAVPA